jgi:23S rRNA pseudouridine2457 synthase
MPTLLFNKPFGVVCQFSEAGARPTLKDFISIPAVYPAGRLDTDSEGLLLLTDDGRLQHRIAHPHQKMPKVYLAQIEGEIDSHALAHLSEGVNLGDCVTRPCKARKIDPPAWLWARDPPIRVRQAIPDGWIELTLMEGKNRQVRRMTAKVGYPTLRLIRVAIGPWSLNDLAPGQCRPVSMPTLALQSLA